jgi:hypothetical protein
MFHVSLHSWHLTNYCAILYVRWLIYSLKMIKMIAMCSHMQSILKCEIWNVKKNLLCLHLLCSHSYTAGHDISTCLYLPGLVLPSYNECTQLSWWQLSLRDTSYINENACHSLKNRIQLFWIIKSSRQYTSSYVQHNDVKWTKSCQTFISVQQQWTAWVYSCSSKKFPSVGGWCVLKCTLMF